MAEFGMSDKQIDIMLSFAAQHPSLAFSKPGKRKVDHSGFSYFLWKELGRDLNYSYENDRDWKAYNYWPIIWQSLKNKAKSRVRYYKKKFQKAGKTNVSLDEYPLKEYQKAILKLDDLYKKGQLKDDEEANSDDESDVEISEEDAVKWTIKPM